MADANEVMKSVMKSAAKVAANRPELGLDPNLSLLREKHPEWFEETESATDNLKVGLVSNLAGDVIQVQHWKT